MKQFFYQQVIKVKAFWLMGLSLSAPVAHAQTDSLSGIVRKALKSQIQVFQALYPSKNYTLYENKANLREPLTIDADSNALVYGKPIYVYKIDFNKLKNFTPNSNPDSLIKPLNRMIIPLFSVITNKLVFETALDSTDRWRRGGTSLEYETIETIESFKRHLPDNYSLLELNPFHKNFVSYYDHNILYLIPVEGDSTRDLIPGVPLKAGTVFMRYAQGAKNYAY